MRDLWATPGVWTRPISTSKASRCTSIAQWIKLVERVDFLLSKRRDVAAAQGCFSRAIRQYGAPRVITLDSYAASHRAVAKLKAAGTLPHRVRIRSSKYLNNVVE